MRATWTNAHKTLTNPPFLVRRCLSTAQCTVLSCESTNLRWIPMDHFWQSNRLKALSKGNLFVRVRFGGVLSIVVQVAQVRFCCLLSWKTYTGNTGWTVVGHGLKWGFLHPPWQSPDYPSSPWCFGFSCPTNRQGRPQGLIIVVAGKYWTGPACRGSDEIALNRPRIHSGGLFLGLFWAFSAYLSGSPNGCRGVTKGRFWLMCLQTFSGWRYISHV